MPSIFLSIITTVHIIRESNVLTHTGLKNPPTAHAFLPVIPTVRTGFAAQDFLHFSDYFYVFFARFQIQSEGEQRQMRIKIRGIHRPNHHIT